MKVLCCGDRNWTNWKAIKKALEGLGPNTEIIHGGARGADSMAGYVAKQLGYEVRVYPANWTKYGKAAGAIRNRFQFDSENPELVLAFHDDIENSKGTKDMVAYARSKGCPVNVVTTEELT
jgi:D-arabinose 1-dehydrogenase-like Zn-dependent alcohol dehydrogenase